MEQTKVCFKCKKEKHFKIMVNIFNENNVNYEIDKFPF